MNQEIKERIEMINRGEVPEGYKKTKVGIIPKDWKLHKVKDVMERVRNPVEVDKYTNYRQIGIRSHGKGIFYKEEVTGEVLGNKSVFWIEPNCFIVNIVFAWELAISKTTENELGMIASHRFPMYKPIKEKLDLDFITYFFKTPLGKYLLELASPGGAGRNKTLGQKEFSQLNIPVSKKVIEQQKIAKILSTWDKAIELKEKLIEQKKEQKKGLMETLLTGKIRLHGFNGEWKKVEFNKVFLKSATKKHQISKSHYLDNGLYPVIDQGKKKIIAYSNQKDRLYKVEPHGVIIFGDHTREIKFIDFNFILGADGTHLLKTNEGFDIKFYYYFLCLHKIPNTGYNRHFKYLKEIIFTQPSIQEQKAIANILSITDKEIELLEKELEELKQQKKGLMQLLLTGKVRLNV